MIGCAIINNEKTIIKMFVSRLFLTKLLLNFINNIEKTIRGPKLKNGHIKKVINSFKEIFSTKIPKK